MSSLILCAVLILPSSLAVKVTLHTVDLSKFIYDVDPVLVCPRHEFIYQRGDEFTMYLRLTNNSLDVTKAVAVVKNELGIMYFREEFSVEGKKMHFHPKSDKITIDVELSVNKTCESLRILSGREVSTTKINITAIKYNDICLKENHCLVLVDPTGECKDRKFWPPQPCEDKSYVEVVAPAYDQRSETANETKNNSIPSSATDNSKEGAENHYFIIMIVTSITAIVALILLLVIAIRHRCWINNPPGILQILPTNPNPFYENVLFRNECQQEIEELERREYDVVAAENEYVEIYNRSSTK